MFDDLIKTVKAQLYDRVTSPLFSCFFISWIGWNYKFIFVLFSGMKVDEKFKYIGLYIYPDNYEIALHGLLYPLLTTLFVIYLYPYPARYTYAFYRKRQVELKEIQQKIDDDTPLTKEEAKKIRKDAFTMNIEFEKEIEKLREENISLRSLLKENNLQREPNQMPPSNRNLPEQEYSEGSENKKYIPFYDKEDKEANNKKLLVTGQDFVKKSIEDFIQQENIFNGHSFMVMLNGDDLIINLLSKSDGKGKQFKYKITIPSGRGGHYEHVRIKSDFKEDFLDFIKKNGGSENLENV